MISNEEKIIDLSGFLYALKLKSDPKLLETDILDLIDFDEMKRNNIKTVRVGQWLIDVGSESWISDDDMIM